jgi:hypothetical protein
MSREAPREGKGSRRIGDFRLVPADSLRRERLYAPDSRALTVAYPALRACAATCRARLNGKSESRNIAGPASMAKPGSAPATQKGPPRSGARCRAEMPVTGQTTTLRRVPGQARRAVTKQASQPKLPGQVRALCRATSTETGHEPPISVTGDYVRENSDLAPIS